MCEEQSWELSPLSAQKSDIGLSPISDRSDIGGVVLWYRTNISSIIQYILNISVHVVHRVSSRLIYISFVHLYNIAEKIERRVFCKNQTQQDNCLFVREVDESIIKYIEVVLCWYHCLVATVNIILFFVWKILLICRYLLISPHTLVARVRIVLMVGIVPVHCSEYQISDYTILEKFILD